MLETIIAVILTATVTLGTLGGCSDAKNVNNEVKENNTTIEESQSESVNEEVTHEDTVIAYLESYGIKLNDSVGTCPMCQKENMELTNVGYCNDCTYVNVYSNEHDPEIGDAESVSDTSDDNEINLTFRSVEGKCGEATKTEGYYSASNPDNNVKDNNGFNLIVEGNDGFMVTCSDCNAIYFDNIFHECPNCNSTVAAPIYFNAGYMGYDNNVNGSNDTSIGSLSYLYDEDGSLYKKDDNRFAIQGIAGMIGLVRDVKENGRIVAVVEFSHMDKSFAMESNTIYDDVFDQFGAGGLMWGYEVGSDDETPHETNDKYRNIIELCK